MKKRVLLRFGRMNHIVMHKLKLIKHFRKGTIIEKPLASVYSSALQSKDLRGRADEHLLCSISSYNFYFPYSGLVKL